MQENPLMAGLGLPREPRPLTLVIFGASGDLTRRKLVPALFSLFLKGSVPGVQRCRVCAAGMGHCEVPRPRAGVAGF